jgi:hypothetical protein
LVAQEMNLQQVLIFQAHTSDQVPNLKFINWITYPKGTFSFKNWLYLSFDPVVGKVRQVNHSQIPQTLFQYHQLSLKRLQKLWIGHFCKLDYKLLSKHNIFF